MHLKLIACNVLWREAYACAARSPHVMDIVLRPQGLHDQPDTLRDTLQREIDAPFAPYVRTRAEYEAIKPESEKSYDAVLLGYALCSNGAAGLRAGACPLVIPRGHDCITLLLGSRRRYREYFDRHPGTYWYTSGWIETCPMPGRQRFERMRAYYARQYGEENAEFLLESEKAWFHNYRRATYIDWGFPTAARDKAFTRRCADELGWEYDTLPGDPGLLQRLTDGVWSDEDFLVLQPGEISAAAPATDRILSVAAPPLSCNATPGPVADPQACVCQR